MRPKEKPAMTEFSMETAASARVPTWPAKTWVIAPREYWHTVVKMAGAARNQSFTDSLQNSLKKSRTLLIGWMSSASATKEEANELFVIDLVSDRSWSSLSFWFPLGERSGCLESAMLATERKGDLPFPNLRRMLCVYATLCVCVCLYMHLINYLITKKKTK